ncbi:MAG: CotH kinase family protein [Flavobacteriales bacterium]|nr:CotH kinase family protein [Flavobacteriales bacterium]MCB9363359.1 CotH kinase family protein [Flavobacteriales bacterium]
MVKYIYLFIVFIISLQKISAQCNSNEKELTINIVADNWPIEISWEVENLATSTVVASGNSTGSSVCLDSTICYRFTIYDSYGDGICCNEGNGYYELYLDGILIKTGGEYTFSESKTLNCNPIDSSNLALVIINTNGQTIQDNTRIIADMQIIYNGFNNMNHYNDFPNNYNDKISIEKRGSSSQMFPKKSYSLETQDAQGNNNNVSLIDMPQENDWVLYAPYSDKSLMRNVLTYKLGREIMSYAPRTQFCEVVINDEYLGVYVLTEKIKRDKNRVDIAKLDADDLAGDSLTGGYIIKIDKTTGGSSIGWTSPYAAPIDPSKQINFLYHYPKEADILPAQKTYIENYITDFEDALNGPNFADPITGYTPFIKDKSFIDFFIFNELSKNVDGYRISSFLYKDKDSKGGKLKMGPLWDFNIAYGNSNYCDGEYTTGWQKDFNSICQHDNMVPFWWNRLLEDTTFANKLKCRWEEKRLGPLHLDTILNTIDSIAFYLNDAQQRNFDKWNILGNYVWPNSYIGSTYQDEVNFLKYWITSRISWMDNNMPGNCSIPVGINESFLADQIKVYPNPAKDVLNIEINKKTGSNFNIEIHDIKGKLVTLHKFTRVENIISLPIHDLVGGFYLLKITSADFNQTFKFIKTE